MWQVLFCFDQSVKLNSHWVLFWTFRNPVYICILFSLCYLLHSLYLNQNMTLNRSLVWPWWFHRILFLSIEQRRSWVLSIPLFNEVVEVWGEAAGGQPGGVVLHHLLQLLEGSAPRGVGEGTRCQLNQRDAQWPNVTADVIVRRVPLRVYPLWLKDMTFHKLWDTVIHDNQHCSSDVSLVATATPSDQASLLWVIHEHYIFTIPMLSYFTSNYGITN